MTSFVLRTIGWLALLASGIVEERLHPRVFASRACVPFFTRNAPTTREALADSSSQLVYLANETAFALRPERSNFQRIWVLRI